MIILTLSLKIPYKSYSFIEAKLSGTIFGSDVLCTPQSANLRSLGLKTFIYRE